MSKKGKGKRNKGGAQIRDSSLARGCLIIDPVHSAFSCVRVFIVLWWFRECCLRARARVKIIRPNPRRRAIDKFLSRGTRRGSSDYRLELSHASFSSCVSAAKSIHQNNKVPSSNRRARCISHNGLALVNNLANWDTWTSVLTERVYMCVWLIVMGVNCTVCGCRRMHYFMEAAATNSKCTVLQAWTTFRYSWKHTNILFFTFWTQM